MQSHLPKALPNEPEAYRAARNELLAAEADLRAAVEAVAKQRRNLPLGGKIAEDFLFDEWKDGAAVKAGLSSLFANGKNTLILYSYMYGPEDKTPCPACTSLLDGLNGASADLNDRTNLAVVVSSPIERLAAIAEDRHWAGFRLLSCSGNDYNKVYLGESDEGGQRPMCTVFIKTDTGIHHFWSSELLFAKSSGHPRHMDMAWPLWNVLDLLPEGRGSDWFPKLSYE